MDTFYGLNICSLPPKFICWSPCCCLIAKSHLTLCNPMDCSPPGSSFHGILQARILEWVAIPFSRGSSRRKDWTLVSCIGRQICYHQATREAPHPLNPRIKFGWDRESEALKNGISTLIESQEHLLPLSPLLVRIQTEVHSQWPRRGPYQTLTVLLPDFRLSAPEPWEMSLCHS